MHDDLGRLDFGRLTLTGRGLDFAFHRHAATGREPFDLGLVIREGLIGDDLNVAETTTVIQLQKAESSLGIASSANPTLQADLSADGLGALRRRHGDGFHFTSSP